MQSTTNLPFSARDCGHVVCRRQAAQGVHVRCPNNAPEEQWTCAPTRISPAPLSELEAAQTTVHFLKRERSELRAKVHELSTAIAGQKRKESSSSGFVPTCDPRLAKKPRVLSLEEQYRDKISRQEQRIAELESDLSKARDESNMRRNSDQLQLFNVQTCLKDLIDKGEINRGLIRKMETDADLKDKAASEELNAKKQQLSTAMARIYELTARVAYLEEHRKNLANDAARYRGKFTNLKTHYDTYRAQNGGYHSSTSSRATSESTEPERDHSPPSDQPALIAPNDGIVQRSTRTSECRKRPEHANSQGAP
ncbi:hypothetical protein C8R47DRAFT_234539 [Mycena vitilis]|nr:hypothetical protein C8R47DRAFT_234539 [Mycena vitilis]